MDETTALLGKAGRGETKVSSIRLMGDPVFHLDDMEGRAYQIDRRMSGCYPLICTKPLNFDVAGRYYVDGKLIGSPIISEGFMGSNIIGLFLRGALREYDKDYTIRVEGLAAADGSEIEPFEMTIHTLPKVEPGAYPEHDRLVLDAAREGAVLLKNNGALPLGGGSTVNAFGSGAVSYRLGCVGAGKINPRYGIADRDDLQLWSEMRRITGVDVDLTMIAATNIATLFPLTIASGDMPDMWMDFSAYTNGFDDAIEEGIVEPLNDYLSVMPNLNAILEGDKEMRRQCYTDSGYFAAIPSIKVVGDGHQAQGPWFGYVARKDWLDEMNMDVPETYDDLEKVMDAMMQQYDTVKTPIYMSMGIEANPFADPVLYGGYGVTGNYIQVDGEVRYSPLEDGYKGYVEMLHRWIEKGYLSTDFPYNILPWLDTGEAAEQSYGVFPMIYTWFDGYKATVPDDDFDLVALKPLKVDAGDTVHIGSSGLMASPAGAICADSENIELICKWWDYLFGEEGITLGNWGIEGKTYEVKDNGEKTWIGPFVNEDNDPGFDLSMVQWEYLVFNMPGYIQVDREYCLVDEKAVEFIDQWDDCETDYNYPMGATMTAEENQAYASRFNDLNTYVTEQTLRFIMGESSFDEWDSFIDTIYSMGAEELTTYKQAALDRYNNR